MRFAPRGASILPRGVARDWLPLLAWLLLGCGAEQERDPDASGGSGGTAGSTPVSVGEGAGRGSELPLCAEPPLSWSTGVWAIPHCAPPAISGLGTLSRASNTVWTITLEDAAGPGCSSASIDISVDGPIQPAFDEGSQLMVELDGFDGAFDQLHLLLVLRDMQGSRVFAAFSHALEQWASLGAPAALGFDARFEERCEVSDPGCNEVVVQYDAIVSDDDGDQRLHPSQRTQLKLDGTSYELDYHGSTDFRGITRSTCVPLTTGQFLGFVLVRSASQ